MFTRNIILITRSLDDETWLVEISDYNHENFSEKTKNVTSSDRHRVMKLGC